MQADKKQLHQSPKLKRDAKQKENEEKGNSSDPHAKHEVARDKKPGVRSNSGFLANSEKFKSPGCTREIG